MCFDSQSSSQANQTQQTTNTDLRVAGGNDSINVSAQSSSVNLTMVDAGAVQQAFGFASEALHGALTDVEQANERLADAYKTSKAGEQRILVAGVIAVAGIVAVKALAGR